MSDTSMTSGIRGGTNQHIYTGRAKLKSIHLSALSALSGGAAGHATVKIFDGTSASGTEIARISTQVIASGSNSIEFDMHGVICNTGLFATLTIVGGSTVTAAYSVEFV